jgi:tRNA A-37 threonylcarbamoyl transferase component Bud32
MVVKRQCTKGTSCASACISRSKKCRVELSRKIGFYLGNLRKKIQSTSKQNEEKQRKDPYDGWTVVAQGFHGKVAINPEGTRAVKVLRKDRPDGKEGRFGEYEVELATKMGELGHSPRVHSSSDSHIEMDVAKGAPLWKDFKRGEDEPVMNAAQAKAAAYALRDLHRMGFAHRDAHSQQFIVNGDDVKLVDFGLSRPLSEKPLAALHDLTKSNSVIRFDNPELANDQYIALVNKYLVPYRELGESRSKAAIARRQELAEGYIRELQDLQT